MRETIVDGPTWPRPQVRPRRRVVVSLSMPPALYARLRTAAWSMERQTGHKPQCLGHVICAILDATLPGELPVPGTMKANRGRGAVRTPKAPRPPAVRPFWHVVHVVAMKQRIAEITAVREARRAAWLTRRAR